MNLVIDIGNSRIKSAIFNRKKLIWHGDSAKQLSKKLLKQYEVKHTLVCNVSGKTFSFIQFLKKQTDYIELTDRTPLPIKNKYETPKTLGKDRLAAAVGFASLFPKTDLLVIDMGTCITCDFVNSKNEFLGGAILPGIEMRLKAMHQFTGNLPLVKKGNSKNKLLGRNTKDALLAGGVTATVFEIESIINGYKLRYEKLRVGVTGGDSTFFAAEFKKGIFANPHLVLIGLNEILEYNRSRSA